MGRLAAGLAVPDHVFVRAAFSRSETKAFFNHGWREAEDRLDPLHEMGSRHAFQAFTPDQV